MAEDATDFITVQAAASHELTADRADLHVTVKGASLFTGKEALKKAREVAQLVSDLTGYGVPPEDITLSGVSAEVSGGAVLKSSQAIYRLRVHCTKLETLADLIGLVTSQKNAALRGIEWGYPDTQRQRDEWLTACITWANGRAARIADGLGVRLLGVRRFSERYSDPEAGASQKTSQSEADTLGMRRRSAAMTGEDLGMEVSHTKTVEVSVTVEYRVSGYE